VDPGNIDPERDAVDSVLRYDFPGKRRENTVFLSGETGKSGSNVLFGSATSAGSRFLANITGGNCCKTGHTTTYSRREQYGLNRYYYSVTFLEHGGHYSRTKLLYHCSHGRWNYSQALTLYSARHRWRNMHLGFSGYLGISLLFKTAPMLYFSLKFIGGIYLVYVGFHLLEQESTNRSVIPLKVTQLCHRRVCNVDIQLAVTVTTTGDRRQSQTFLFSHFIAMISILFLDT